MENVVHPEITANNKIIEEREEEEAE